MSPLAIERIQKAATNASAYADALAEDCMAWAGALRDPQEAPPADSFEPTLDRMQKFLVFLVLTAETLDAKAPAVADMLGDYCHRLLQVIDSVEDALARRDMFALSVLLRHEMTEALCEYAAYDMDVCWGLQTEALAA